MVDIAKIMKYAPKGVKLYSPLLGEVSFVRVNGVNAIEVDYDGLVYRFHPDGKYWDFDNASCLLFPSKESTDWDKWAEVFSEDPACQGCCIHMKAPNAELIVSGQHYCGDGSHDSIVGSNYFNSWAIRFASPAETEEFFERLEKHGFVWNNITESVEKKNVPKCNLKPKDWVLVRDNDNKKWKLSIFGYYEDKEEFPFICIDDVYKQCIPYEQNKHLLATTGMPAKQYIN